MKKLILISSLLSAGTLFANATVTFTITDLSQDASGTGWIYNGSTGWVNTGTFGYYTLSSKTRYAATSVINVDLTALGIVSAASTATAGIDLLAYSSGTSVSSGQGMITQTTGVGGSWNGSYYTNMGTSTWEDLLNYAYTANGRTYVTLAFQGAARGTSGSASGGTSIYAISSDGTALAALLGYSSLTGTSAYSYIYVNSDYVTGISAYTALWSESKILSAASAIRVEQIPEPSMFGLLAGMLGLALAGTRRRRR